MKITIILLFAAQVCIFSQTNEIKIKELNIFADSVNNLISNSTGAPGEIYSNTINTIRNIRAIGVQETKITYYYFQKDDSVYEDSDGTAYFIPRYNDPLKIQVEYNIASSQNVVIEYFPVTNGLLYRFNSKGAYGDVFRSYWISGEEILRFEEKDKDMLNAMIESGKFSKEVYSEGLLVIDKSKMYLKLYYDMLKIEYIDK